VGSSVGCRESETLRVVIVHIPLLLSYGLIVPIDSNRVKWTGDTLPMELGDAFCVSHAGCISLSLAGHLQAPTGLQSHHTSRLAPLVYMRASNGKTAMDGACRVPSIVLLRGHCKRHDGTG
jgi:hypothetical protein